MAEGRQRLWPMTVRVGVPVLLVVVAVGVAGMTHTLEGSLESAFPLTPTLSWSRWQAAPASPARPKGDIVHVDLPAPMSFESGDTLGSVLEDLGVGAAEAHELVAEVSNFVDLRRLRPDDQYLAHFDLQKRLAALELMISGRGQVSVRRSAGGWKSSWLPFRRTVKTRVIRGRLGDSLEASIEEAGGPALLSLLLSDVFQWDLDFTRDLRSGDTFSLLYDTVYLDGSYHALGDIQAAVYVNDGRSLEAYRFGETAQYFDGEGRPMRKMFLRSPLRYSRVTSRFSHRRFHPILKRYRPHHGVDYGAPVGTPVRSTASGRVVYAGWEAGGGKTVKVRHANGYLTAYLHLSGYARGIRSGRRVEQGDVIGYVGSTGLSTGPHLDYRVQRNGRWIDPLSLRSIPSDPIPAEQLPAFAMVRDEMRDRLAADEVAPQEEAGGERRAAITSRDAVASPTGVAL